MKYVFVFFVLTTGWWNANAQVNLVPNPSFEVQDSCQVTNTSTGSNIYYTRYWFSPYSAPGNGGGVELFSHCCTNATLLPPHTENGYQQPFDGQNFSGVFHYYDGFREYIEVGLVDSLQAGKRYCLHFRYSYGDSSSLLCDGLGAYFTLDSLHQDTSLFLPLNVEPQLMQPDSLVQIDTANWLLFNENFVAQGGERYLTIGNFKPLFENYIVHLQPPGTGLPPNCYMFIDAVEVFECDSLGNPLVVNLSKTLNDAFNVFPNPTSSNTACEIQTSSENVSIVVTDVTGRKLFEIETENGLVELPTSQLSNGVYFVHCKSNGQLFNSQKLLVQH